MIVVHGRFERGDFGAHRRYPRRRVRRGLCSLQSVDVSLPSALVVSVRIRFSHKFRSPLYWSVRATHPYVKSQTVWERIAASSASNKCPPGSERARAHNHKRGQPICFLGRVKAFRRQRKKRRAASNAAPKRRYEVSFCGTDPAYPTSAMDGHGIHSAQGGSIQPQISSVAAHVLLLGVRSMLRHRRARTE